MLPRFGQLRANLIGDYLFDEFVLSSISSDEYAMKLRALSFSSMESEYFVNSNAR
jgi:hypothetical protein